MARQMTVSEAVDVALTCIENWHGQATGDDTEDELHEGVAEECKCDMGKAYRALRRKLARAKGATK